MAVGKGTDGREAAALIGAAFRNVFKRALIAPGMLALQREAGQDLVEVYECFWSYGLLPMETARHQLPRDRSDIGGPHSGWNGALPMGMGAVCGE